MSVKEIVVKIGNSDTEYVGTVYDYTVCINGDSLSHSEFDYMVKRGVYKLVNDNDNVNNPKHYQLFPEHGVEVIDVVDRLCEKIDKSESPLTASQSSYYVQILCYLMRFMDKNGSEDVKKAKFYLDRLVKSLGK